MKILKTLKHIAIIVFVISLGACIRDDDNPNSPETGGGGEVLGDSSIGPDVGDSDFYTSKNNSARLDGDVVGPGKADNESLRKVFDVTFTQASKELKIEKAYINRTFASIDAIYIIIPVRNISDNFLCDVSIKDIVYKDQDGNTLASGVTGSLHGSVGQNTKSEMTDTCLAPKEVGYAVGITSEKDGNKLFSATSSVEITSIEGSADTHKRVEERMLPTKYVTLNADRRGFEITVENQGTQSLQLTFASSYILLDGEGWPLTWGFLDPKEKDSEGKPVYPTLAPGETASFEVTFPFDGTASTIRPVIDFEISGSSRAHSMKTRRALLDPSSFESIDEYSEYLLQQKELENVEREKRLHE
jgi:hypothetical protein